MNNNISKIITAGSAYLDIDAYACMVAMKELLCLQGVNAIAYSTAVSNYSVCQSLVKEEQVMTMLPDDCYPETAEYIIVDVSDPEFIKKAVPLDHVVEVYDHHAGYEEYWRERIGNHSHIEFIGAAATLIYREWKAAGLQDQMSGSTAKLLIAAILDNTLNLTSAVTTLEDIETFNELCLLAGVDKEWCAAYFTEVQASVESDLKNALFSDMKSMSNTEVLPARIGQICVWNAQTLLQQVHKIRQWFSESEQTWMLNVIDIQHQCSYFVCDDLYHQKKIEKLFDVQFIDGIAKTAITYLRKEIIKKAVF